MALDSLFIDTGGFYALISTASAAHHHAIKIMEEASRRRRRAITTDYIIDETVTLLRARGLTKLVSEYFSLIDESKALTVEWVTPDLFRLARVFMLKHLDQEFSFTDCTSFVMMKQLGLHEALASDSHFRIAGFNPLLANVPQ